VPLAREHIDALLAIENASHPTPWSRRMFESELENEIARFWIFYAQPPHAAARDTADGESPIVGYGGFWNMLGDGNITNLTIAEAYRGQGFGKAALCFLLEEMIRMGMEYASLEVRASNIAARSLYEGAAFTRAGLRKGYYSNGEDALVLTRKV
jgi:ribosomal-protein-alanine N-acetyltransferase